MAYFKTMPLDRSRFQTTLDSLATDLFFLSHGKMCVAVTNYGARVVAIQVPDRTGKLVDIAVGYNRIADYINNPEAYYGATIGRVGNRIADGRFTLDGVVYKLVQNDGLHTLHGGKTGLHSVVWNVKEHSDTQLVLSHASPAGTDSFPGNVEITLSYTLTHNHDLQIRYRAITDAPTILNLTNHTYFNLNGEGTGSTLQHTLQLQAERYTPVTAALIPTGELRPVEGSPFDFRTPKAIGAQITDKNTQLEIGNGYDHNFITSDKPTPSLRKIAAVVGDQSGIQLEVHTQEPGVQLYTGNFMNGQQLLKSGARDDKQTAFCLETQHFPDSPNYTHFPSIRLDPGQEYRSCTVYRFGITE